MFSYDTPSDERMKDLSSNKVNRRDGPFIILEGAARLGSNFNELF